MEHHYISADHYRWKALQYGCTHISTAQQRNGDRTVTVTMELRINIRQNPRQHVVLTKRRHGSPPHAQLLAARYLEPVPGEVYQWAWILAVQLAGIYKDDMLPWVLSINVYSKVWSHYSYNATTILVPFVITKQLWLQSQLTVVTDPQ